LIFLWDSGPSTFPNNATEDGWMVDDDESTTARLVVVFGLLVGWIEWISMEISRIPVIRQLITVF